MTLRAGDAVAELDGARYRVGVRGWHPTATVGGMPVPLVTWSSWRWALTRRRATRAAVTELCGVAWGQSRDDRPPAP